MHPLVALLEHADELAFEVGPTVVAPQEQRFDGFAQRRIASVNLLERPACGTAVELGGLLADVETAAEAGEERLLQCKVAAKGVDGLDAQLRGKIEEVPAEGL